MALKGKRLLFVDEFVIDMNATQAAKRAGYSEKTAGQMGHELLKNVEIQAAISDAQARRSQRTEITQDRVLAELAKVGFSDIRNVVTGGGSLISIQDWDDETAGSIASVEVVQRPSGEYDDDGKPIMENVHKMRMWDKLNALEKLGKHLGMFKDDSTITHKLEPFTGFEIERAQKPD